MNDQAKIPKLKNAWNPDIIDLPSLFSICDACKLIATSYIPQQQPNIKAKNIKKYNSVIKGITNHKKPCIMPAYITVILEDNFLIILLANNIVSIDPIAKVMNV